MPRSNSGPTTRKRRKAAAAASDKPRGKPSDACYTVWLGGEVRTATARDILQGIQRDGHAGGELRSISVQRYANALVEDAKYFLPDALWQYFKQKDFGTTFDRALEYLASMPTSGIRILERGTGDPPVMQ